MFRSPREALGALYQPPNGYRSPRYTDAPRGTGRSPWDYRLVGALVYGPRPDYCGVVPYSAEDVELCQWACHGGPRTKAVRRIERKLRELMRSEGIKEEKFRLPTVVFVDENGRWVTTA